MRGRFVSRCAVVAVLAGPLTVGSAATGTAATTTTGKYIVVLKDGAGDPGVLSVRQALRYRAAVGFVYRKALSGYSATMTAGDVASLRTDPSVAWVQSDTEFEADAQTVPFAIERVAGPDSSTRSGDGTGTVNVNVAVLDTGVDGTHPELNVVGGVGCINNADPLVDLDSHGTQVAGLIAGRDNDSQLVGIAPGAPIKSIQVLNKQAHGTAAQVLCGIDAVTATRLDSDATNDIAVANMSLGGSGSDDRNCGRTNKDAMHLAICNSVAAGVTYVVGAGNESDDIKNHVPASYDEVLTATAISDFDGLPGGLGQPQPGGVCATFVAGDKRGSYADDTPAHFSNFATLAADQAHTVAAPGVCDLTTYPQNLCTAIFGHPLCYGVFTGTSAAAPVTSGVVALCIASGQCAGLTPAQIVAKIVADAAAYNVANPGYGFTGDPQHPIAGKYYGNLIRAAAY